MSLHTPITFLGLNIHNLEIFVTADHSSVQQCKFIFVGPHKFQIL